MLKISQTLISVYQELTFDALVEIFKESALEEAKETKSEPKEGNMAVLD
jgi:hypothetical protein